MNLAAITVGPDGRAAVVWVEVEELLWGSTKNGSTCSGCARTARATAPTSSVTRPADSPVFDDPSVAAAPGRLYVGFVSGDGSGRWDVRAAVSLDGGATFVPSVKVNDDPSAPPTSATSWRSTPAARPRHLVRQPLPRRERLPRLVARRRDRRARCASARRPSSTRPPSPSAPAATSNDWLGDYLGLAVLGTDLYAAWTAPRGGPSQVYVARGRAR